MRSWVSTTGRSSRARPGIQEGRRQSSGRGDLWCGGCDHILRRGTRGFVFEFVALNAEVLKAYVAIALQNDQLSQVIDVIEYTRTSLNEKPSEKDD